MTATQTTSRISARNWRFFEQYAKNKVDMKCYECPKFTFDGKTCKGVCDKE